MNPTTKDIPVHNQPVRRFHQRFMPPMVQPSCSPYRQASRNVVSPLTIRKLYSQELAPIHQNSWLRERPSSSWTRVCPLVRPRF